MLIPRLDAAVEEFRSFPPQGGYKAMANMEEVVVEEVVVEIYTMYGHNRPHGSLKVVSNIAEDELLEKIRTVLQLPGLEANQLVTAEFDFEDVFLEGNNLATIKDEPFYDGRNIYFCIEGDIVQCDMCCQKFIILEDDGEGLCLKCSVSRDMDDEMGLEAPAK
jgi:hypothetical protein